MDLRSVKELLVQRATEAETDEERESFAIGARAIDRFQAVRVKIARADMSVKCPKCGAFLAAKEPGSKLFCSECGQCIRLYSHRGGKGRKKPVYDPMGGTIVR